MFPVFIGILCISFTIIPAEPAGKPGHTTAVFLTANTASTLNTSGAGDALYNSLNLQQHGLSKPAFDHAWRGYQYLLEHNSIARGNYLTICDFSQSSKNKRLYVLDVVKGELVINTYVAHGKNSGGEYATKFSNTPESLQSSLGFYVSSNTYIGKHGLSLRLKGVEPGFNDNAWLRTIVIHGADYVNAARVKAGMYMGRSWGCPAVPLNESATLIQTIKNGTCLFIYHPSGNYLNKSKILNG
jgi:hypothetical protein